MNYVTSTAELNRLCKIWQQLPFITIDLEFLREHTYYAKLCLIQVGSTAECAVIDPLSSELDLQAFFALLQNPDIVKVFHSGRQDVEILYFLTGKIPAPLFDTQIAAMVLGFGESVSYETLVRHMLHRELDKTCRLSDWSRRPLTEQQLFYALSDVTHLVEIYQKQSRLLKRLKREDWITDELNILRTPQTYEIKPEDAWLRIHHRSHNPRFLTIVKELAAWREERSQRRNTPRQSFIKDDTLLQIATDFPQTIDDLTKVRSIRREVAEGKLGLEIIEVLHHCLQIPACDYVTPPHEPQLPSNKSALFMLLKLLLKIKSLQHRVVARLIASDDDLLRFAARQSKNLPLMQGWRYEIFGHDAEELCRGNLSLTYNPVKKDIEFKNCSSVAEVTPES